MKTAETKNTDGPWTVEDFKVLVEGSRGIIAETSYHWVDPESARANARLCAAAPELLSVALWAWEIYQGTDTMITEQIEAALRKAGAIS